MIIRNSQYSLCDGIDARCTGNSVQNVSGTFDHSFRWHTFCCFFSRNIMELAVDVILNTFDDFNTWLSLAFMLVAIFFRCFLYIIFYFFFLLFCSLFQRIEQKMRRERTKNAQASNRARMENSNLLYTLIYMLIQYNE